MNSCPYCQTELDTASEPCEHLVATLFDESNGFDGSTPLLWDWRGVGFSKDLQVAFDAYFDALCEACDKAATGGEAEAHRLLGETTAWPSHERTTLEQAIEAIEQPDWRDDYASVRGCLRVELDVGMRTLVDTMFRGYRGAKRSSGNVIDGLPGASWISTSYFAKDARTCVSFIIDECEHAITRLHVLTSRCQ